MQATMVNSNILLPCDDFECSTGVHEVYWLSIGLCITVYGRKHSLKSANHFMKSALKEYTLKTILCRKKCSV